MTSEGSDGSRSSSPMDPRDDISLWLSSLHLSQYAINFTQAGYLTLADCGGLTEEKLLQVAHFPTGHRRRILHSLEVLMTTDNCNEEVSEMVGRKKKPVPFPRTVYLKEGKRVIYPQNLQAKDTEEKERLHGPHTLPAENCKEKQLKQHPNFISSVSHTLPRTNHKAPLLDSRSAPLASSNESLTLSSQSLPSEWESFLKDTSAATLSNPQQVWSLPDEDCSIGFQGVMVDNDIYETSQFTNSGPRPTRSYKLRHRPVPEIPECTIIPPVDRKQQAKQQEKVTESTSRPLSDDYALLQPCVSSQEPESVCSLRKAKSLPQPAPSQPKATSQVDSSGVCDEPLDALSRLAQHTLPQHSQSSISPYACFYGRPKQPMKMGWLDKLSPQGNRVFQRRWVKFDGENLTYYNNDKEMYSKGLVSFQAVKQVRSVGDNKFEVVTSVRTFVFRVEKEGERQEWLVVLQTALKSRLSVSQTSCKLGASKSGYVEMRGHKGKVYLSLTGTIIRLCKTDQDFNSGIAITVVDLTAACVKHMDRKGFEINTPFKSFCFTAESEREREEWIEALRESIVETLSNYEVAEKVWFNQSNRSCADCRAPHPEWASINLGLVICKMCAGQHRFLGSGISQIRSLKLDSSIWTNELVEALCSAVLQPDVLLTMALVFSGADVMCATGDPDYSTPYLLAQKGGQRLQMEFLYHNQLSDMIQRWCTLEGGYLSYYDSEESASAIGRVDVSEIVSLAIISTETIIETGAVFTFEIYLESEKMLSFGTQTSEAQRAWVHALTKCLDPERAESLLKKDCELFGRLYYKEGHDFYHWRRGWFSLVGSELFLYPDGEQINEAILQLKRLQELTVSTHMEGDERIQVLLMVENGRTIYLHGFNKQDFTLWHSAIQLAAGRDGTALSNQQLTKNDIPIIVDSCIAFVTQYGLCHQGVYQKTGDPKRAAQLLEEFTKDARNVKLRVQDHRLEDVTDVLKLFLYNCEDALLAKELYPYWISALDEVSEKDRMEKYCTYIQSLPKINTSTLAAILQHLYRIQRCSHINQMKTPSLACVFSSCLFQTGGHAPQETRVVEDLINNYIQLFSVNNEQVKQMEKENRCIMRWKDTTFSPAGDLIFEVYVEKKEPDNCCLIKVSPTMCADELTETTLEMKGIQAGQHDFWTTFEIIETGELEGQKELAKEEQLKFKDGSSKLLSGNRFQDKYLVLRDKKLLLYKDAKSAKPEREVLVESVKCYVGIRKKLKPTSKYFCCAGKDSPLDWVIAIISSKYQGDLWPTYKKSKSSHHQRSREQASACLGSEIDAAKHSKEENKMAPQNAAYDEVKSKSSNGAENVNRIAMLESCFKNKIQKGDLVQGLSLASAEENYSLSRNKMAVERSVQTLCRPVPYPDSGNHTKSQSKKDAIGCGTGQLPQSLLNELSSVLNQTGRTPKEES
ncbi:Arf-GAP with Rho-GAP domain, ANK repeat and PH domain-containing protein 2 [Bagarius yarrelli]|uniref:Arf-GAP with Rho-GAP domain, ANK repeat and PH domain-containing protein 2 n=1 Tax=Bagarius yarrelli TaxID=175774 RepID=A0A556TZ54_BAGYA|nr:Arf-GAP with Rho-GAP domain, ANK repeat and PH domain-containing protein 2 [Bagarius yarrelli]